MNRSKQRWIQEAIPLKFNKCLSLVYQSCGPKEAVMFSSKEFTRRKPTVGLITQVNITQANCTVPQLIPDRKMIENDLQNGPQMIPRGKSEWPGLKLPDHRVTFIIATKSINSTE